MSTTSVFLILLQIVVPALGLTGLFIGGRLAARYVRAVERRGENSTEQQQLLERVGDLEIALEEARSEISRLETAQEFTTRLLSGRSGHEV